MTESTSTVDPSLSGTIKIVLSLLTLAAALVFPPVFSYIAVYITIIGLIGFAATLAPRPERLRNPATLTIVAAVSLLVLATLLAGAGSATNWLAPAVVLLVAIGVGLLGMPIWIRRRRILLLMAIMALVGAVFGLVWGSLDILMRLDTRAGGGNNPIHYGALMTFLGFSALSGLYLTCHRWRYVFLAGPVTAFTGVLLSGSRGPFLAVVALTLALAPLILRWNWKERTFRLLLIGGAALGAVLFAILPPAHRIADGIIQILFGGTAFLNYEDDPRVHMTNGAIEAFKESPIWGHGYGNMIAAAEAHFPASSIYFGRYDHLHADLLNFMVAGGMIGVVAYVLTLLAPLLLIPSMREQYRKPGIILALTASVGAFSLGLTNTVIGILPQTVLFAVVIGWAMLCAQWSKDKTAAHKAGQ